MANSATFRIRRVKCRDEMGGKYREKFGNDEIKCAVFSADLRGSPHNSGRIGIYDDFDDGDVKSFDPPREVLTLDLAGAAGEVELAFSVLLIESQLSEGSGLQKAWDAFVKSYQESVKKEMARRNLSVEQAAAIALPGYLRPTRIPSRVRGAALSQLGSAIGTTTTTAATAASGTRGTTTGIMETAVETLTRGTEAAASEPGTGTASAGDQSTADKVGDAFIVAAVAAVVAFGIKLGEALIDWARDKVFSPVPVRAKIDASAPPETVPANATGVAEFRGYDGIYEMEWDILVR